MHEFFHDVILHSITESFLILPFLFITYILIEYIERRTTSKFLTILNTNNINGSIVGALLGSIPQCGVSAMVSNLFSRGLVTIGTIVAVFLATSDEMIPVLIASDISIRTISRIIIYKIIVAIFIGILIDVCCKRFIKHKPCGTIDDLCDGNCHCDKYGIIYGALHHTISVTLFILVCNIFMNGLLFFVDKDTLTGLIDNVPIFSHIIAAVLGLIPNCSISVILSNLYSHNIISLGVMLSGLFTGAGVGLLVLVKTNKCKHEVVLVLFLTLISGLVAGIIADIPIIKQLIIG